MSKITININGKQVEANPGSTILEVCQSNGIDVPTLCHLKGVTDTGSCRMCVVEVDGERRPVPSCAYPVRDGLVIKTHTDKIEKYRRQILELIFTERNHFCMFCERSGDCELQKLAYRYQMDHVRYPYDFPALSVDSLSQNIVIDHNRCVLCGRCIRTCTELVGCHTLDFANRGWKTVVSADLDQPLGESSCVSCGACVQACPTGAILAKSSLYKPKTAECELKQTVCTGCGAACELNVLVKDNNLVRIEAPSLTGTKGALCRIGRFQLARETRSRITAPLLRNKEGQLRECTYEQALQAVAERLKNVGQECAGLVSSRYPVETILAFKNFMNKAVGSDWTDTLDGEFYRNLVLGIRQFEGNGNLDIECSIDEINRADCLIVFGDELETVTPIVGTIVRRAVHRRGASLIMIDPVKDPMYSWSDIWLKSLAGTEKVLINAFARFVVDEGFVTSAEKRSKYDKWLRQFNEKAVSGTGVDVSLIRQAAKMYGQAKHPLIIYGSKLLNQNNANAITSLLSLADLSGNWDGDKIRVLSLKQYANSRGAWETGIAVKDVKAEKPGAYYLLLDDEEENDLELLRQLNSGSEFIVVHAGYHSIVTSMADVVIPSRTWAERAGKFVSMDGHVFNTSPVLEAGGSMPRDEEILSDIARRMGL